MASIFSTQNLQTFLRRKYLRPPSRPPGPPGRGGRRSPRSGPDERSPPEGRSPTELPCAAAVALISSAIMLLKFSRRSSVVSSARRPTSRLSCGRGRLSARVCSRGGGGRLGRWRLAPCVANRLDLVQALLFFIDAHGDELDHRFSNAQAAF